MKLKCMYIEVYANTMVNVYKKKEKMAKII